MILVMPFETAKGRKQQQYLILIQILLVTDNELEDARRDEADTVREGKLASAMVTMNSVNNIAYILTMNLG